MTEHQPETGAVEKVARCPRCKSEELSVGEDHLEHGTTLPGRVVVRNGQVIPPGEFIFEPGEPVRVVLLCDGENGCGHEWRSRWPVSPFLSTPPEEATP